MSRPFALAFGSCLLAASILLPSAHATTLDQAKSQVQARIAQSGADVAIVFRTLDGKDEWFLRADDSFHAASTMKIPVMIELFHQVREGKLKLDDPLVIKNEFHSIVDGTVYHLSTGDDSDADLYKAEGQTRTLSQLCELMITVSSNFATNLLIEKLGVQNIRATVHALHADGINVLRGVEDQKAFDKGLNNTTTARGLQVLLDAIAEGKAVDAGASRQMVAILKRQKFNESIPAGLPPGIEVAHKTGEITKIHHDAAIVYAKRPFILVILTRGIEDQNLSAALIADIARILYSAVEPGTATPTGNVLRRGRERETRYNEGNAPSATCLRFAPSNLAGPATFATPRVYSTIPDLGLEYEPVSLARENQE